MNTHLTDEQIAESLSGAMEDISAGRHLAACKTCTDEVARVRSAIRCFAMLLHEEAAQKQLQPIPALTVPTFRTPKLVWAAAVVLLAVAMSLLRWTPAPPAKSVASQQGEDTLLLEIQQDLNREVPEALAPALVLTAERNRIIGQERQNQNR